VDPVIARMKSLRGKATRTVLIYAIRTILAVTQRAQRRVIDARIGERILVFRVPADVGVIRRHVGRVCSDGHCPWQLHLLPAGCGFRGEGDAPEQLTGPGLELTAVRAGV